MQLQNHLFSIPIVLQILSIKLFCCSCLYFDRSFHMFVKVFTGTCFNLTEAIDALTSLKCKLHFLLFNQTQNFSKSYTLVKLLICYIKIVFSLIYINLCTPITLYCFIPTQPLAIYTFIISMSIADLRTDPNTSGQICLLRNQRISIYPLAKAWTKCSVHNVTLLKRSDYRVTSSLLYQESLGKCEVSLCQHALFVNSNMADFEQDLLCYAGHAFESVPLRWCCIK